jgi:hypothetical protein
MIRKKGIETKKIKKKIKKLKPHKFKKILVLINLKKYNYNIHKSINKLNLYRNHHKVKIKIKNMFKLQSPSNRQINFKLKNNINKKLFIKIIMSFKNESSFIISLIKN